MKHLIQNRVSRNSSEVEIDGALYEKITEALRNLFEIQFIEEKFDLVIENYLEFEDTLSQLTSRFMVVGTTNESFNNERILVNRRIVNLLTATKAFTDQSRHHFSNIFHGNPLKLEQLSKIFSSQYDDLSEYRAMEAIRDYVQHRDSPVHSMTHSQRVDTTGSPINAIFGVTAYIKIDVLKEDGKFKKKILDELEQKGDQIDLRLLVRGYVEGIWRVQQWIRSELSESTIEWETTLRVAKDLFINTHPNEDLLELHIVRREEPHLIEEEYYLKPEISDFRRFLENKNNHLTNLRFRYFTSK
jgi:hypothetical protein